MVSKSVFEFMKMKNEKSLESAIPQLRSDMANEMNAGKRIDIFEKLLICDPASITRTEVSRITYSCKNALKEKEFLGSAGEKLSEIRRKALSAPEAEMSFGEKLKLILMGILLLAILAALKLTPLGDYLFSEEGVSIMIIGGVAIFAIAGIFLGDGFYGFVIGGALGMIVFNIGIHVIYIGHVPLLILGAVMLFVKAFRSDKKRKKIHDEWIAEERLVEEIEEIRPYVEYIRKRARQMDPYIREKCILEYYDFVVDRLNFYDQIK